ncbi:MAG: HAD hydrolase-like protein [Fibrobacteria bacterium]|nr:HAD hydrolase-like protein [Fibrobacteria bacterium]
MIRPRVVLFDFDGTLADTFPRVERLLPRLARELRFRCPPSGEIRDLRELPVGRILSSLGIAPWKVPLVLWRARALLAVDPEPISLFPGISELLGMLDAAEVEWAILTSNSPSLVRTTLRKSGVPEPGWLEAGLGLHSKAKLLRRMAERFGVERADLLFVSDETRDVDAARKAQVPMVSVSWGYSSPSALERAGAGEVIGTVVQLAARILAQPVDLQDVGDGVTNRE